MLIFTWEFQLSGHSHCMPAGGNVSVQHFNRRKYTIRFINAQKSVKFCLYTLMNSMDVNQIIMKSGGVWDNQCTPCRLNGDFVFMQTPIGCWHMIIFLMLIHIYLLIGDVLVQRSCMWVCTVVSRPIHWNEPTNSLLFQESCIFCK